jgi:hypothetical protein
MDDGLRSTKPNRVAVRCSELLVGVILSFNSNSGYLGVLEVEPA